MAFPNRDANADLAFGVLSDLHMTHRGEGLQKLTTYFEMYSKVTPAIDAHVFSGDILYQINMSGGGVCNDFSDIFEEPYAYLAMARKRYCPNLPLVYAMGNHEYPQHCKNEEVNKAARVLFEKNGYFFRSHTVIKGYHFIAVGIENFFCRIPEEDAMWAIEETKKALAESGDKPVFVVYHPPIIGTVIDSCDDQIPAFKEFMLSDPRIINICGHLHTAPEHPRTIYQKKGGATVIHAPDSAVGNVTIPENDHSRHIGIFYSRSLFFEVTGTKVVIHKIDNMTEKETGEPWVIDVKGEQYYTDDRFEKANTPVFPAGASVEVTIFRGEFHFRFPKAKAIPLPFNDDADTPNYRFEIFKAGEDKPVAVKTWHSDYAFSVNYDDFRSPIPFNLAAGDYTVRVTPISFFKKEGTPITGTFTVPENMEKKRPLYMAPSSYYNA